MPAEQKHYFMILLNFIQMNYSIISVFYDNMNLYFSINNIAIIFKSILKYNTRICHG